MSEAGKMLVDAIKDYREENGKDPLGIVGSTFTWQRLVLETAVDGRAVSKTKLFLGVPIKIDDTLPDGEFLLLESLS
jgi:hypothetical protein